MITNDSQLKSSEQTVEKLKITMKSPAKEGIPAAIVKASRNQLKELIEKVENEIEEYKTLKALDHFQETISGYDDFRKIPILYRIIYKLTLDQFARKVEISARQIARYEKEEYKNIGMANFLKILEKLSLEISGNILFDKEKEYFETRLELHSEPHQHLAKEMARGR